MVSAQKVGKTGTVKSRAPRKIGEPCARLQMLRDIKQLPPMPEPFHTRKKKRHRRQFIVRQPRIINPSSRTKVLALSRAELQQSGLGFTVHHA